MRSILKMLLHPLAPITVLLVILIGTLLFTDALSEPLVQMSLFVLVIFGWMMIIAMKQESEKKDKKRPASPDADE